MSRKILFQISILLFLFLTALHLAISPAYSINWDFGHVFYAGLKHLQIPATEELYWKLPFRAPDPRNMTTTPFGAFQTSLPALGYIVFTRMLHVLPFDTAFSLPAIFGGILGIIIFFLFLTLATHKIEIGLIGALFLATYPRFFGDMHTNVKDIPTAAFFTLTILFLYFAVQTRKTRYLVATALSFAITFHFKINAIFLPPIGLLFILFVLFSKAKENLVRPIVKLKIAHFFPFISLGFLAFICTTLLWIFFWREDPLGQFLYMIKFFQDNTSSIEVLLFGNWFCSTKTVPTYYPYLYLAIVTPLPILLFVILGFIQATYKTIRKNDALSALLLIWFFVPLLRYISPQTGVIDGIRHFQEVIYPMLALSSLSFYTLVQKLPKNIKGISYGGIFCYLIITLAIYHPYQLSYYSELVGGIWGAYKNFDVDYWGISQKAAIEWLNQNAPENSIVHIAMTGDTAAMYLRPDLRDKVNSTWFDQADYVVVLNRQSFFYRYWWLWEYFLRRKTAHVVTLHGVPMTWIYDNKLGSTTRQPNWWKGESPCIQKYWSN